MTVIEKLNEDIFTDAEKQVVEYLLDHLDDLAMLSINDLAKNSYTSNATVIRVCHKVGIQGYRQLKLALLKELQASKFVIHKVDYTIPFQSYETTDEIMQSMFSLYQDSIKHVHHSLDVKTLKQIAKCCVMKKRIFIYGHGDSQITALNFMNKLVKINIFPILATEYNEEIYISQQMQRGDFALFISYSGDSATLHDCMKILNEKNISTALITANEKSILNDYSQYTICIPDYEKENKIATFYSQLAFLYILNNLYAIIYHMLNQ